LDLSRKGPLRKRDIYTRLVENLTDLDFHCDRTEDIEELLNLIIVDHSLTSCLLALVYQKKKQENNMMRRLSSFKTSPKSLLDYIDIDQELYGYENNAAVFQDDNENDAEDDLVLNLNLTDALEVNSTSHNLQIEQQTDDSEEGSDMDNDLESSPSPTISKKGIRKFLCMPVKSMTPSKKFCSFRRSIRKKKSNGLINSEDF